MAKGELAIGDVFRQESIIGGVYMVRPLSHADVHGTPGIIPELTGSAHVYARSDIVISDDDPLRHGFRVSDMWAGRASMPVETKV